MFKTQIDILPGRLISLLGMFNAWFGLMRFGRFGGLAKDMSLSIPTYIEIKMNKLIYYITRHTLINTKFHGSEFRIKMKGT